MTLKLAEAIIEKATAKAKELDTQMNISVVDACAN
jgi:uncharacterized protein GlcG (DUF336 family)